jgi:hypothetical protein
MLPTSGLAANDGRCELEIIEEGEKLKKRRSMNWSSRTKK